VNITSQEFESFVPVYDAIPETWEEGREFLVETLRKISNAINVREIGWLLDEELLNGQQFFPGTSSSNDQLFRSVFRKVIDFGTLPNTGTKTVPHGITFDSNFTLLHLYGAATDPIGLVAFDLGHAAAAPNQVELFMNATNIVIITGSDRSAYTRTFITIEYIQEI
jgi:hypothetical protein